jgi:predicted Zn-dependent peptidase
MVAGPGRVLPVALQYEPNVYGVKVEPLPRREVHQLTPSPLTVLWVEDHVVPLVDVRLVAHCGLLDAPAGQPDALRVAWSTAFDLTRLQALGAEPRAEVRSTLSSFSFSVARPNLEAALALVAEGLTSPRRR